MEGYVPYNPSQDPFSLYKRVYISTLILQTHCSRRSVHIAYIILWIFTRMNLLASVSLISLFLALSLSFALYSLPNFCTMLLLEEKYVEGMTDKYTCRGWFKKVKGYGRFDDTRGSEWSIKYDVYERKVDGADSLYVKDEYCWGITFQLRFQIVTFSHTLASSRQL